MRLPLSRKDFRKICVFPAPDMGALNNFQRNRFKFYNKKD